MQCLSYEAKRGFMMHKAYPIEWHLTRNLNRTIKTRFLKQFSWMDYSLKKKKKRKDCTMNFNFFIDYKGKETQISCWRWLSWPAFRVHAALSHLGLCSVNLAHSQAGLHAGPHRPSPHTLSPPWLTELPQWTSAKHDFYEYCSFQCQSAQEAKENFGQG